MWQIAVALTGIISGLSQTIGKRQTRHMSAFQSGVIRDVTTLAMVAVVYIWQGNFRFEWPMALFLVMGVMESVSIAAYFAAQREHMAATAVFSYPFSQLLIVLMAGFFFGEWHYFDIRNWQGMINTWALITTLVLMAWYGAPKSGEKIVKQVGKGRRWLWMLVGSAMVISLSNIQSKWAVASLHYSPTVAMLWEFAGLVVGGLGYVMWSKQGLPKGVKNWGWGVLQGLLFGWGAWWYVGLLTTAPLGVASILRRVVIVLVTITAALWGFGEWKKLSWRQGVTLGLGLLVFGVVMAVNR